MNETTTEVTEIDEPTQTPPRVWDYVFHAETDNGYLIVKIDADSKEEAIEMAYKEFKEWGDDIWTPTMPVFVGKFNYELHPDYSVTVERGEVVDFSSVE